MRTERVSLNLATADGRTAVVAMRYDLGHQQGCRCVFGALGDAGAPIGDEVPPALAAANLFEILIAWRATVEPEGWRLLHAAARMDCWARPERGSPYVARLTTGADETVRLHALDPAPLAAVTTVAAQQAAFAAWKASLTPVHAGRSRGGGDFGPVSKLAGRILGSAD